MSQPDPQRVLFDQALCHASLLIERLLFYTRYLGLLPRTSSASDPLGGMVVSDEDVGTIFAGFRRLQKSDPARRNELLADPLQAEIAASRATLSALLNSAEVRGIGFVELVRAFGLLETALDPLLLALAPEWDARIGRLLGFLNNDTSRQRPTFGQLQLALQSGLPSISVAALDKLERHLLRPGLIELEGTGETPQAMNFVRVPAHVVELSRVLLPEKGEAKQQPGWEGLFWDAEDKRVLADLLRRELTERVAGHRLIVLEGTPGSGRSASAHAAAEAQGMLSIECMIRAGESDAAEKAMTAAMFRAKLSQAVLIVRSDGVLGGKQELWAMLAQGVQKLQVRTFVLTRPDEHLPEASTARFLRVAVPRMFPTDRRQLWERLLAAQGLWMSEETLDYTAIHFDITPGRVKDMALELRLRRGEPKKRSRVSVAEVTAALREITVQKLTDQATLYVSDVLMDDLVLESSTRERLDELIQRMQLRYEVLDGWRFGGRSMRGYGVTALFAGPPGTGKTAAAGAVANALGLDLYIVDLSRVMSKWVGETEQNLARVFDEAEASSVALLFDEADSLFGKRSSDVKSASDRFANITVNYLLQRMERYSGLAILTTNLESSLDSAFSRRISTRVYFDEPDEEQRRRLWAQLLPPNVRYADDVDLSDIVQRLEMPGARIRSALVRAAFRAAAAGAKQQVLTQQDIYAAALLEYEDMGRLPPLPSREEAPTPGSDAEPRPESPSDSDYDSDPRPPSPPLRRRARR